MIRAFFELVAVVGSFVLVYGALALVLYILDRPEKR